MTDLSLELHMQRCAAAVFAISQARQLTRPLSTCPAGIVKLYVLSSTSTSAGQVVKSVTKTVQPLAACPASPCNNQSRTTGSTAGTPSTGGSTSNDNTVMYLTGNPAADLSNLFGLLTGGAGASLFKMPTALDAATVLQLLISE